MPAVESATSQSDQKRTVDLDTLTQRVQAIEAMIMTLGCFVPHPDGFVKSLDALSKAVAKTVESSAPGESAEFLATLKRTRNFVEVIQEARRDARQ